MPYRLLFIVMCCVAALIPLVPVSGNHQASLQQFPGWPATFEGRPVKVLSLTRGELHFEKEFPGRIAKFSDGSREIALRWVTEATRSLHPATDCLRGAGYALKPLPILRDADGKQWGQLEARNTKQTIRVRERIEDTAGNSWTDVSSWYWAALLKRSRGPWLAITVIEKE
jgi:hypothetical protein